MHTVLFTDKYDPTSGDLPDAPTSAETLSTPGTEEGGEGGDCQPASPPLPPSDRPISADGKAKPPVILADDVYRPAPATNPVVDGLVQAGLYQRYAGDNCHEVVCPWESEHTPGQREQAYYFEPTEGTPLGTFHCPCDHKEALKIGSLLRFLKVDRSDARCKPRIRVIQGELHRVVQRAGEVLSERGGFYRSNGIVTLKFDAVSGDVTMEQISEQALTLHLSAACDWQKWDGRSEEWRRCDVPAHVVKNLLNNQSLCALPELTGLARQPFLRRGDGKLITTPGYDVKSGVYASFDPTHFELPLLTRENALAAFRRLVSLLDEFEFASNADKVATVCAMLTATIRDYLKVAPGFNITASSPGSGKSYLASVIAPFAGPGEARNISYPMTQEEATKVVLSLALEQPSAVCFDDMPTDWLPHGAMNRMLTSGTITERKLGSNTVVTARASSFVMGTGNNIRPLRDMARRVASIYILPKVEMAATRDFTGNPAVEVRKNRGQYVSDALTIIAAWRAAGSPKANVPNVAGFEEWSDLCRHSLLWLGTLDPATSLIEQISHDPDQEQLANLLLAWRDTFGKRPTLVRQVLKKIDDDKNSDLYDAVMELPCVERGHVNQSRFGRYLGRNKNRIVHGLQLVEAPHSERRAWAVIPISPGAADPLPVPPEEPTRDFASVWVHDMLAKGKSIPALDQPI